MRTYDKYKNSGIEWIGEIPNVWEVKKLKYVASCNDDVLPETTNKEMVIKYVEIGDVSLINGIEKYTELTFENSPSRARRIAKLGDVIISTVRTYLGAIARIDNELENLIVSTGFAVVRCQNIETSFLGYYVKSQGFIDQVISLSTGVSYPSISSTQLMNIEISVPPLKEQNAIIKYLYIKTTEIDQTIADKEALINLFEEEKKALINEAVTKGLNPTVQLKPSGIDWLGDIPEHWEVKKLKYLVEIKGRIGFRGYTIADIVGENEGAITLSPSNIKNQEIILDSCQYISWDKYYESPEIQIFNGDIVFVKTGSTIGKVGYFENITSPITLNPQLVVFKNIKAVNKFLYFILISKIIEVQNSLNINGGATESLTQDKLGNYNVLFPPLKEQKEILQYIEIEIESINNKIKLTKQEIELLKEYRQALIFEAVTGKIKVFDDE